VAAWREAGVNGGAWQGECRVGGRRQEKPRRAITAEASRLDRNGSASPLGQGRDHLAHARRRVFAMAQRMPTVTAPRRLKVGAIKRCGTGTARRPRLPNGGNMRRLAGTRKPAGGRRRASTLRQEQPRAWACMRGVSARGLPNLVGVRRRFNGSTAKRFRRHAQHGWD
jgi:hypothetical protein